MKGLKRCDVGLFVWILNTVERAWLNLHANLEGFYKRMGFKRGPISQLEMYKMLP